ncbi:hypothetical protein TNCV_1510141 [Trichonephila clavipes]|nr:hypothetical protein TNCV_1510141 [Trichonephila clavipes]
MATGSYMTPIYSRSQTTSNWPIYTSSTKEKSITSLRIRRALRLENLRVHATETCSSDQREVRLETDRIRINQIRSSERTELRERKGCKMFE